VPQFDINGITVNVERAGLGPPLVLLHGFTGSAESWDDHTHVFGEQFTTYAIDLIGHGRTSAPGDPHRYQMRLCVEDLLALFDRLEIERTALLGYSLGGRVALQLTVAAPDRIDALVLESASPGIADPAERAARVNADEALAQFIENQGLEAFVDRWESLPLFASQRRLPTDAQQRHRVQRLKNNPLGLANSLRGMGAGAMDPVWGHLGQLTMPAILIAGEFDAKYVDLASEMQQQMPNARTMIVPDAGHTVHLEAPELFDRTVVSWLAEAMANK
jgi:2-succinyl-6-hydroxy-2,4-cyclohexadiene-1-carboxylate synthase